MTVATAHGSAVAPPCEYLNNPAIMPEFQHTVHQTTH